MRKIFGVGKYIFFWRRRKRTRTERQKDKNKGNAQDSEGFQANSNRGERSIETIASLDQKNKKTIESYDMGAENHLMVMVE